jgi:4-diphosphocytidyl-2-C-methyl-D-erythritol kinase
MVFPTIPPGAVVAKAPGKINPLLRVGERREDGYHDLLTCFMAVSVYETVTVWPAGEFSVTVRGDVTPGEIPLNEDNLVIKVAQKLGLAIGETTPVAVHIDKRVPVGGGMGGGSADAAAALLALDHLWQAQLSTAALLELAAEVGSDVPFLLEGGAAIGRGRGEILQPVDANTLWWVVMPQPLHLSTPLMYQRLDEMRASENISLPDTVSPLFLDALYRGDAQTLAPLLQNDMQRSALDTDPRLAVILEQGLEFGALGVMVSGSGPTLVWLAQDEEHALGLVDAAESRGQHALAVSSPARGAHLVLG